MREFATRLSILNKKWNYELATCGEKINLTQCGINKNHCIDDDLIIRFAYKDKVLMDYLKVKKLSMPHFYQTILMRFMGTTKIKANGSFAVVSRVRI